VAGGATDGFVPAAGGAQAGATDGFVPAAGGTQTDAGGCAGPVNRGETGCGLQAATESYWSSTGNAGATP
jgi:hypothetical protein